MNLRASEIFERICQLRGSEREADLIRLCGSNSELLTEVRSLLAAHEMADGFLDQTADVPAQWAETSIHASGIEQPGATIGPYKLLEQIGEGGFGTVYMAQQEHPIRRRVALKIIKPGMDTKQVVARFESERQALAVMDHPNIARVIDGGSTLSGRPYFVMELVRGEPITKFCDQRGLLLRARLELFQSVCYAVEHAHQKGIIHRDIKPSNVLVTICDDKPVVKVIDFGIAKATTGPLTDKTLFTEFRQLLGTPLYMSPEQAEQSGVDVDTRTDIYSLGVLLYELLTGRTPIDPKRLSRATWIEVQRMILEEEPSRPSAAVTSLDPKLANTSVRQTKRTPLSALLRGELDWIVLKAIEKDRSRRYPTASQLAADIGRYLRDEAVEATPPSRIYLLRKFAKRNRGVLMACSAVFVALLAGLVGTLLAAKTALDLKAQAEARERQAVRAATAAGASVLLPAADAQRLADGWLAEIEDLKRQKSSQAVLSQAQFSVWRASWLAQHQQPEAALKLVTDVYDQAKKELGHSDPTFLALCNLRIQLVESSASDPALSADLYADLMQGLAAAEDNVRILSLLPQYAVALLRAGRIEQATSQLESYVALQRASSIPTTQADMKRLRSAIDNLMASGKVSEPLLANLKSISDTGRVGTGNSSQEDPELAKDFQRMQGRWHSEFWRHGQLAERMRVEFSGNENTTEWVDENQRVLRGRSGRFELSRSGGAKVLTTYLDNSSTIGGTFIYHLTEDELRIVSGMLANQPSLPEVEMRVFRRAN